MQQKVINVGGVHEYTNVLFLYGLMRNYFTDAGIDLRWIIYPSGSAPLAQALTDKKLDMAIILTDSVTKSISAGAPIRIVSPYVLSPLDWVFHTMKNSPLQNEADMVGKRFAISKYGSGGHLIALLWAHRMGITLSEANFVVVNDMEGAVLALKNNLADIFPWERLTTLQYVESGVFKEIHNIKTPYPPFAVAASSDIIEKDPETITKILSIIHQCAVEFKALPNASEIIAATYHRNIDEVKKSFNKLHWAQSSHFPTDDIENVIQTLWATGAITNKNITPAEIIKVL